ncbi:MAG: DUF4369 domain-containing protein [Chloroflexia bacterium]|nr:DUF4369 domain-containing protein [Chloroflexia bacterium]
MNKLFLFAGLFIMLAACGGKLGDNEFLVKGVIENSAGKTLFLSEFTETGPITVDSVVINQNGEFKLTGHTSYPKNFICLELLLTSTSLLLIDSANVLTVKADANDFVKTKKVTGSDDMELVNKLNDRLAITHAKIDSIGQIYQLNEGEAGFDSIKASIDAEFEK